MTFASRQDAGRRLAQHLQEIGVRGEVVLGLPRGGVVVAAEVARCFGLPLDVLVVRKIGHPQQREFAVGALAEGGVMTLDAESFSACPWVSAELEAVVSEENNRLEEYRRQLIAGRRPALAAKTVMLVDDGLATGATMEAAAMSAKKAGAQKIIVAVPVASASAARRLRRNCDEFVALQVDDGFRAVGCYYQNFQQTTAAEVIALLRAARAELSGDE